MLPGGGCRPPRRRGRFRFFLSLSWHSSWLCKPGRPTAPLAGLQDGLVKDFQRQVLLLHQLHEPVEEIREGRGLVHIQSDPNALPRFFVVKAWANLSQSTIFIQPLPQVHGVKSWTASGRQKRVSTMASASTSLPTSSWAYSTMNPPSRTPGATHP